MIIIYLLLIAIVGKINSLEYNGFKLGTLQNANYGLECDVWIVNDTTLQLTNFKMNNVKDKSGYSLYFSTGKKALKASNIYKVVRTQAGDYSKPIENSLHNGLLNERIIVTIPGSYKNWKHFGVVGEKNSDYLAAVQLNAKIIPEKYCCLQNSEQKNRGLIGDFYNVSSAPLVILDSRTILLPQFSFEGTKPPDGWIFAGVGQLDKASGRKAFVVGKDTPQHHCPLIKDYHGDKTLRIRLAEEQTIYDINYISVFCYEYAADFGHIYFELNPNKILVPPYVPPIQNEPPVDTPMIPC